MSHSSEPMEYFIKRGEQEYGPYSLADLQHYVSSGHISHQDLARSESMGDWVPVSRIIGNVSVPTAPVFGTTPFEALSPPVTTGVPPPDLHWGLLLLISIFSCGFFGVLWMFIQAAWIRRVKSVNAPLYWLTAYLVAFCLYLYTSVEYEGMPGVVMFWWLATMGTYLTAAFNMRAHIEDYYNSAENIGLSLSGLITFFFNVYYFQYHFNRINHWKKTGVLRP